MSKVAAHMKTAVTALAAVVVVAVGAGWWMNQQTNARAWRCSPSRWTTMRSAMSEQVKGNLPDTNYLRAAAFAVILEDSEGLSRVIGTAWPLQAGMLVTNAHVAKVMDRLKPGEIVFVRKPGDTTDIPVTGKRVHPGYDPFNEFVDEAIADSQGFQSLTDGAAMPSAYDVAILEVDPATDLGRFLEVSDDPAALDRRRAAGLRRLSGRRHRRAEDRPAQPQPGAAVRPGDGAVGLLPVQRRQAERAAHREQPAGDRRRQRQPDRRRQRQGGGDPERRHGGHPRWRPGALGGDAELRAARRPDRGRARSGKLRPRCGEGRMEEGAGALRQPREHHRRRRARAKLEQKTGGPVDVIQTSRRYR